MPSDLPKFTLRTPKENLDKLSFIAEKHFRTTNKELEMLVLQYISEYEKENGPIIIEESEDKR